MMTWRDFFRHPVRYCRAARRGFLIAFRTGDRALAEREALRVWGGGLS